MQDPRVSRFVSLPANLLRLLLFCFLLLSPVVSMAAVYDIGPGQPYTTIGSFPWYTLQAGDTVQIHYAVYHELFYLSGTGTAAQPIRVVGVPDPSTGNLPVIDGDEAVAGPNNHYFFSTGTPSRGMIGVGPVNGSPYGAKAHYIEIANLELRNGFYSATAPKYFTAPSGSRMPYNANIAAIYVFRGEHVTITNCTIHNNSQGIFLQSGVSDQSDPDYLGKEAEESRDLVIQYSRMYQNGMDSTTPNHALYHNIYSEGSGVTVQYNYLGPLLDGAGGDTFKDRSAGTIVRYNWIEGGNIMVNLVDAEFSANVTGNEPTFGNDFVYGNVFHNIGAIRMIQYGGDHGESNGTIDRKKTVQIYNNTFIIESDQSANGSTILAKVNDNGIDPSDNAQSADLRNNIIYITSATPGQTPTTVNIIDRGGYASLSANWISPNNWGLSGDPSLASHVTGSSNLFTDPNNNPSFANFAAKNYALLSGSNAIDKSVALAASVTSNPEGQSFTVTRQYANQARGQARQVNGSAMDFGALEYGPAGPCAYTIFPSSATVPYAGGNQVNEIIADAGCSWTASTATPWLSILSGANGSGVGNLEYSVQANAGSVRSGAITIAGQSYPVVQLGYDMTPPSVSITAPVNGASVNSSAVAVTASASDNIGVAQVQFSLDGGFLNSAIPAPPYTTTWDSTAVVPGSHTLTATAVDTSGNTTTSSPVTVTVTAPGGGTVTYDGSTRYVSNWLTSVQTGNFTLEGDITPAGDATSAQPENGLFGLSQGGASTIAGFSPPMAALATIVLFDTDGVIRARNAGAYGVTNTVHYVHGQTYHVRMVVNVPSHVYDVYVTPPGGSETQIASAFAFRSEQSGVTQLDHWDLLSNGNSISASNVTLTGTGQAAPPTFSPTAGSYTSTQHVSLFTTTTGATIYYTSNGSTPTTASAVYSGPITVAASETIKAIAVASGYTASAVSTASYTILVSPPAFTPGPGAYLTGQTISLSTSTPSATIYYTTDGSTPTTGSTVYTGPITAAASLTIKAFATAAGLSNSAVVTASYVIGQTAEQPFFTPATGTYNLAQTVSINTATPSANIYYTTDGSTPTTSSTVYTGPLMVSGPKTIRAIAGSAGYYTSSVGSATYSFQVASPTFSPAPGTYGSQQTVSISTITPSAAIYYTTDGSTPTTGSTPYTGPFTVPGTETVKAIATGVSGYTQSMEASGPYVIGSTLAPAYVQQCNSVQPWNTTTVSCTLNGVAAGDTIVVGAGGGAVTSVTSNAGTFSSVATGNGVAAYLLSNTPAGNITITATSSTYTNLQMSAIEYNKVAASPLDGSAFGQCNGYCTSVSTDNFTTTSSSDILWSFCTAYGGYSISTGTSPVIWAGRPSPNGSGLAVFVEDGPTGAPGNYYGQCTGGLWIVSLALKPAGTGGSPAATPAFTPAGGTYASPQTVSITSSTAGATIYYTTNGSTPTTSSTVYSGPITVSATETVKAIATASGYSASAVGSASFTITGPPTFVQQCTNVEEWGSMTASCTLSGVGAGNALMIGVKGYSLSSVTTSAGTPTSVATNPSGLAVYFLPNSTGGNITVTATASTQSQLKLSVIEYGNVAASPLDGYVSGDCPGYCTSVSTANFTTTSDYDRLWSLCTAPDAGVITPGTAPITWTARQDPGGTSEPAFIEDGPTTSAGTYYGQCTGGTHIITVALKHP